MLYVKTKKMKKYTLSTLFVAGIFTLTMSCKQQTQKSENVIQPQTETSIQAPEERSTDLHNKLMSSFNPNWEVEEPAPTDYPEYYGGSFIDNDGKFVVCVVGNPTQHRSEIATILETDDFLTESCNYSYREMMQVMDKIDAFLSDSSIPTDHPFLTYFAGAGADVFENRVVVQLTELNDAAIQAFKKDISNSPAVMFEKGDMPVLM